MFIVNGRPSGSADLRSEILRRGDWDESPSVGFRDGNSNSMATDKKDGNHFDSFHASKKVIQQVKVVAIAVEPSLLDRQAG